MKAKFGSIVTSGSGKLGGHMFQETTNGAIMKAIGSYNKKASVSQINRRVTTKNIMALWSQLSSEQRLNWESAVIDYKKIDVFAQVKSFNAFQLFNRINQVSMLLNMGYVFVPRPFGVAEYPTMLNVISGPNLLVVNSDAFSDDTIVCLYATAALPLGVSKAKKRLRFVQKVTGLELKQGINIYTGYLAVFGGLDLNQKIYLGLKTVSNVSLFSNQILLQNEPAVIIGQNSPAQFDPDAYAFIQAIGSLSVSQQIAVNNLVLGFKANGTWSSYIAIYPMIGGTAFSHKFNLKNPLDTDAAHRLIFNGGWVHSSDGAKGNGTNCWGNMFIYENINFVNSGGSVNINAVYYSNLNVPFASVQDTEMGSRATPNTEQFLVLMQVNDGFGFFGASMCPEIEAGAIVNTKLSYINAMSGTVSYFENGVFQTSKIQSPVTLNSNLIALNSSGSSATTVSNAYASPRNCAFAAIGNGVSSIQAISDSLIIQNYQIALGRQF